ncbi:hypothetical protein ABZ412_24990 [Nocardia sp. NPDC005746]|uniref:hypothetical protein n=1 Tax=Nocardia sp. NPDC005746 TaxID=3157062 RepID=UPI0034116645
MAGEPVMTLYDYQLAMLHPMNDSVADLTPWSCTNEELQESSLGPIDFVDGFGAVGDVVAFTATDPDTGRQQRYFAHIDWGLLQAVEPAPDWYTDERRTDH